MEGWRIWDWSKWEVVLKRFSVYPEPPSLVKEVLWLNNDVKVLASLTSPSEPPPLLACPSHTASVFFVFGDASGEDFGNSYWKLCSDTGDITNHRGENSGICALDPN